MKQSQLDKAIAVLEGERAVLDLAIQKLKAQQTAKPTRAHSRVFVRKVENPTPQEVG